jgi:hypothetical protein
MEEGRLKKHERRYPRWGVSSKIPGINRDFQRRLYLGIVLPDGVCGGDGGGRKLLSQKPFHNIFGILPDKFLCPE